MPAVAVRRPEDLFWLYGADDQCLVARIAEDLESAKQRVRQYLLDHPYTPCPVRCENGAEKGGWTIEASLNKDRTKVLMRVYPRKQR